MKKFSAIIICAILPTINLSASDPYFWSHEADSNGKISTSGTWQLIDAGGQGTIGRSQVDGTAWDLGTGYVYTLQDIEAPAQITDLTAETGLQIKLSWTAPGDDGNSGTAKGYLLRYSVNPIVTDDDFENATTYPQSWQPVIVGGKEEKTVVGLLPATTHYFAIKAIDEFGNHAKMSNVDSCISNLFVSFWNSGSEIENFEAIWGDSNNDGNIDILAAGSGNPGDHTVRVYENTVSSFSLTWVATDFTWSRAIDWGDYDNDGDLDIAVSPDYEDGVRIYKNEGSNNFTLAWSASEDDYTMSVKWGDYDNDGDLDLLTGNYGYPSRVYENAGNNIFTLIWNSPTGNTYSVDWGDYDTDGDLDILRGNSGFDQIFRNNGDDTFTSVWSSSESETTYLAIWGDYDNDGDLDFLTGGSSAKHVYRNNGNDTFTLIWTASEEDTRSVAWGDYDNDGNLDIIAGRDADNTSTISVFKGDGSGNFDLKINFSEPYCTYSLAWGDYDNDGDLDLLRGSQTSGYQKAPCYVYKNINNEFGITNSTPLAPTTFWYAFNAGDLEIYWDNGSDYETVSSSGLYYNVRLGSSTEGHEIISGKYDSPFFGNYLRPKISSTTLGLRIKSDRLPESTYYFSIQSIDTGLRASNYLTGKIYYFDVPPAPVTDLVVTRGEQFTLSWTAPGDSGKNGQASGYLLKYATYSITNSTTFVSAAEYSQSWEPLVSGQKESKIIGGCFKPGCTYYFSIKAYDSENNYGGLSNYANNYDAAGIFYLFWASQETDDTYEISLGDYDNDGDLDQLVGNSGYNRVYRNDLSTFTLIWTSPEENIAYSIAWGDYDSDGDLDQLVGNYGSGSYGYTNRVYRNDGENEFTLYWNAPSKKNTYSVAWGDYDNDGDLDQLSGNASQGVCIYRNDKSTFTIVWSSSEQNYTSSVGWGDYDRDGDLDIMVGNVDLYNRIYRNDKSTFTLAWNSSEQDNTKSIAWGDYDNDGDLDQLVGNYMTNASKVYRNNGNGTFTVVWSAQGDERTSDAAWGDYDNDGYLDILIVSHASSGGSPDRFYRNLKNGSFQLDWTSSNIDRSETAAFGDFDNDGDLDLFIGNRTDMDKRNLVFKNYTAEFSADNSTPSIPSSGFDLVNTPSTITLTWDPPDDNDETPVDGLYYNIRVGTCPSKTQGEFGFDNIVAGKYSSPLLGNYLRPRISSGTLGVKLNLERDATYYWSVQTIDAGLRASPWSAEQHFELFAPSAISNLSALTGGSGAVGLTWTAPGDDGLTGSADSYVVRYSTLGLIDTETEFNTATNYSNSWTPQVAGSTETHTVDGLTAGVTYFFAIKSKDEYDNISNLSNSAFAYAGSGGGQGAPRAPINPFELGEVYSFPNPAKRCNPCLHIEVGFADSIEVKIYNIAGELVYKTELAGNPLLINNKYAYEYVWDTGGVASGVYIYLIGAKRSGFNEIKVMKKMAVIK